MLKTAEQVRAYITWQVLVNRFGGNPETWEEKEKGASKYLTLVRQTATRIHVSGLGQALVFLKSRLKKDTTKNLNENPADDISAITLSLLNRNIDDDIDLITRQVNEYNKKPGDAANELIGCIRSGDLIYLMRATDQILEIITWLSNYLQGAGVKADANEDNTSPAERSG